MACVFGIRRELLGHTDDELFAMKGADLRGLELSLIDGWHPALRQIVQGQDPDSIFPVSVRTSVPIAPWTTDAVTLLGDAIHVMSPAIGVGANTALRDARVLSGRLAQAADGADLLMSVRAYEAGMVEYGYDAVRESAERGRRLVGQDPLEMPVSSRRA